MLTCPFTAGLGLNIHEETERGDNEAIGKAGKGPLGVGAGCGFS